MCRMRTRVASIVMLRKCPLLRLGVRHAYHNTRYQNKGKMAVIAANLRDEWNNLFPCPPPYPPTDGDRKKAVLWGH